MPPADPPRPEPERVVAGLSCREVLARLSDLVDGELPPGELRSVREHVAGCDWCERFGGRFAGLVRALRREMAEPEPLAPDVEARLVERLRRETGS